jgi:hypothetical protein
VGIRARGTSIFWGAWRLVKGTLIGCALSTVPLLPSLLTMTIMTATAVGLFRESFFCCAATTMTIPRTRNLFSR